MHSDVISARDGTRLARRRWDAATPDVRGTVVIVHGIGEHAARYGHVATRLCDAGWRTVAVDQRGHGESGGRRGALVHADDLLHDLATVIDAERSVVTGSLVLLGHSMGGAVAAQFVAEHVRSVDALVLSSPAFAARMSWSDRRLLAAGRRLFPDLTVRNGLPPRFLSHDRAVVAAYLADPLVHDRVSPRLAAAVLDGAAGVMEQAPRWRVPTLLLWAGDDHLVDPRGSAAFAAAAPSDVVTAHCIAHAYHEIFNEPDRDLALDRVVDWLALRSV